MAFKIYLEKLSAEPVTKLTKLYKKNSGKIILRSEFDQALSELRNSESRE